MNIFTWLIKGWGGILLLSMFVWGGMSIYQSGYRSADYKWSEKWRQRDAYDAEIAVKHYRSEREEEYRRQQAISNAQKAADKKISTIQHQADISQHAADGLHRQLLRLRSQLANSETSTISAIAAAGHTRAEAEILLIRMLKESDDMAGKYAKEADRAYIAGSTCERIYSGVISNK
jgi:hypothetical protein